MYINANIINSARGFIDKKDVRPHLRAVCFNYDEESGILSIVGTNAQIMIVNKVTIKPEYKDFCNKFFKDNKAYILESLNPKTNVYDFSELDNRLVCNGVLLTELDMVYPRWQAAIPEKDLVYASKYCGFNADFIKQIDKALGWKDHLLTYYPLVNKDEENEHQNPHRWDLEIFDDCKTIVIVMPYRISVR